MIGCIRKIDLNSPRLLALIATLSLMSPGLASAQCEVSDTTELYDAVYSVDNKGRPECRTVTAASGNYPLDPSNLSAQNDGRLVLQDGQSLEGSGEAMFDMDDRLLGFAGGTETVIDASGLLSPLVGFPSAIVLGKNGNLSDLTVSGSTIGPGVEIGSRGTVARVIVENMDAFPDPNGQGFIAVGSSDLGNVFASISQSISRGNETGFLFASLSVPGVSAQISLSKNRFEDNKQSGVIAFGSSGATVHVRSSDNLIQDNNSVGGNAFGLIGADAGDGRIILDSKRDIVVDNFRRAVLAIGALGPAGSTASGNEVDVTLIDTLIDNNDGVGFGHEILAFGALNGGENNLVRLHFNRVGPVGETLTMLVSDSVGISGSGTRRGG